MKVQADYETRTLIAWCKESQSKQIRAQLETKIDAALAVLQSEVSEEMYIGSTRLAMGRGGSLIDILQGTQFLTLNIRNLALTTTEISLREALSRIGAQGANTIAIISPANCMIALLLFYRFYAFF
jgi:hypothetical protein